jgi:hypothetical protein
MFDEKDIKSFMENGETEPSKEPKNEQVEARVNFDISDQIGEAIDLLGYNLVESVMLFDESWSVGLQRDRVMDRMKELAQQSNQLNDIGIEDFGIKDGLPLVFDEHGIDLTGNGIQIDVGGSRVTLRNEFL